jgi:hypothetical protein
VSRGLTTTDARPLWQVPRRSADLDRVSEWRGISEVKRFKSHRAWSAQVTILALLSCLLGGCAKMEGAEVKVRGVSYTIPKDQIVAGSWDTPRGVFVRSAPPGTEFHLVLDAFSPYLPSAHGPNIPRISRLSDNRFRKFYVVESASGPVVCEDGPQPHYNCGIEILDGPVRWGVLFDKSKVPQADQIRAAAKSIISSYRV